ncbi:tetratricopeptide repeat protein [Aestuariivirga litoralis]|uniref:tetratricopeptide repeat protein n=1 Tax=Aestuariivirga litoralis TaxID=2650924 RepID=UPI0011B4BD6D|nr:hypothetical protein [Aestuariivirga litoralis]
MVAALFPPPRTGSGWLGKVTLALGAVFLATTCYLVLKGAVSGGPAEAPAMSAEALKKLTPGERADAAVAAQRSFVRDPLDAAAVLGLAVLADAEGNAEASERLRLSAGDMSPRATKIQAEAMIILLKRRDFDAVMTRVDGLIRARPSDAPKLFALAAEIAGDPDGAKAVARMLASNPPWRERFFASLLAKGQPATATRLMDELQAMGAPVRDAEVAGVVDNYMKAGAIDTAYAVWLSTLGENELRDVKRVYDGGFAHPIRNLRFDWTVKPADGLTYRQFPRNTASMDQTLQFDLADFKGSFANLSQMLRLRPGRFRLTGEVRFEGFESPTGLVFRLYCFEAGRFRPLDSTAPLPQSTQWIGFDKSFDVPPEGCTHQMLQLESQRALEKSQLTRGTVAVDAIDIDILPGLAP